jgi:hypothetical protein
LSWPLAAALALAGPVNAVDIRVGFPRDDGGVTLYAAPRPGLSYHVLSERGATIYTGPVRSAREARCDVPPKYPIWIIANPQQRPVGASWMIVVGAPSKVVFKAVREEAPDVDAIRRVTATFLRSIKAAPAVNVEVRSAGRNGSRQRYLAIGRVLDTTEELLWSRAAVIDIERGKAVERYAYELDEPTFVADYVAAADLSEDGLADVFLLDYGDYKGPYLLIEERGGWHVAEGAWPGPC